MAASPLTLGQEQVDRSGHRRTTEDRSGQNWTEVDNVLFARFIFDPSKAESTAAANLYLAGREAVGKRVVLLTV